MRRATGKRVPGPRMRVDLWPGSVDGQGSRAPCAVAGAIMAVAPLHVASATRSARQALPRRRNPRMRDPLR